MSGLTHSDGMAPSSSEQRNNIRLLTKLEVCRELGISLSTLDRRIASGAIQTRKKPMRQRHRVFVVMEGSTTKSKHDDSLIVLALTVALERILGLETKGTDVEKQLREEQQRNSLLFEELKATAAHPPSRSRSRPWWRFWDSPR